MPVKRAAALLPLLLAVAPSGCEMGPSSPLLLPDDTGTDGGPEEDVAATTGDADAGQPAPDCLEGVADNELGVGRRCEAGGDQCDGTPRVTFCSADFVEDGPPFCTFPCNDTPECGEGAVCAAPPEDPEGTTICWPGSCVEEE